MRRIVIVVILVAAVAVAGFLLLRPKGGAKAGAAKVKAVVTDSVAAGGKAVVSKVASAVKRGGKTSGSLKPMTKEERKAELKKLRAEEKRRKKELKRQEREKKRLLKFARSRRGKRRTTRKGVYYTVKAVVSLGSERYALVDSRRVVEGDVVMGRRIVSIQPDRIEVEAFGRRSTVRVGESLMPYGYGAKRR